MQIVVPNISKSKAERLDRIYRYALDQSEMERFRYQLRARQIKAAADKIDAVRFSPLGEMVASIDAHTYLKWELSHPGCWKDPTFIREFIRDNPECRGVKVKRRVFNGVTL